MVALESYNNVQHAQVFFCIIVFTTDNSDGLTHNLIPHTLAIAVFWVVYSSISRLEIKKHYVSSGN
jgi:hypothetical protein